MVKQMAVHRLNADQYDDVADVKFQKQKLNFHQLVDLFNSCGWNRFFGYLTLELTVSVAVLLVRDVGRTWCEKLERRRALKCTRCG